MKKYRHMAKPAASSTKGRDLQPGCQVKYTGHWYRIEHFTGSGVVDNELSPDPGASYRSAWGQAVNGRRKLLILLDDEDYFVRVTEPPPRQGPSRHDWPEEARVAAVNVLDRHAGPRLRITVPVTMHLAADLLSAVTPLIRAAERERLRTLAGDSGGRGQLVRETWVETVLELVPDPKPSWTAPYAELDEFQRTADDRIGDTVAAAERERIAAETITRNELERAVIRLAEATGNRDSYYPALADDIFRYVQDHREEA